MLFSIGLVFMAVAATDFFFGSTQQFVQAAALSHRPLRDRGCGIGIGAYRLFIIVVCAAITLGLTLVLSRTRFGSRLRAAVDDPRVAGGLGIDVNRVYLATFAFGSGLAGLGGALGAELLGLDPTFPLKYMIYFLVVCRGRRHQHDHRTAGRLAAARHGRRRGQVLRAQARRLHHLLLMIAILLVRPQGLFARPGAR